MWKILAGKPSVGKEWWSFWLIGVKHGGAALLHTNQGSTTTQSKRSGSFLLVSAEFRIICSAFSSLCRNCAARALWDQRSFLTNKICFFQKNPAFSPFYCCVFFFFFLVLTSSRGRNRTSFSNWALTMLRSGRNKHVFHPDLREA